MAISIASKAQQAVGALRTFVQLAEPGQFPRGWQVYRRALIALGFFGVEHATAQGGGDTHDRIELMLADEGPPIGSDIQFILWRNHVG
ncbi:hypothetical protein D3C72_2114120 [compost metagenome]